jgi:pyruvate,water dikinase
MVTDERTYIRDLSDLTRADAPEVGAKSAGLGALLRAGFPVPGGFVLTTEAFDLAMAHHGFSADTPQDAVAAESLPEGIVSELLRAAAALGDVPLAVRSSGVAEDLPDASFAGQYETVLGVRGVEAILAAVRRCWASAFSERVRTYRRAQGLEGPPRMAVLVQRLVPADAAGVAFTADPVTGDRRVTVVSAVRGLGERLVSGQATPDEWVVTDGEAACRHSPEGAIDAAQVRSVAALARRVESYVGSPQDIEWALAGGEVFLLQARPITALPEEPIEPVPVPVVIPEGYWQRDAEHFPEPTAPVDRSLFYPIARAASARWMSEFGLLMERIEFTDVGGWHYIRLVPLGGKDRPAPPAWIMPLLVRIVPQIRSRLKQCVEAVRQDKAARFVRQWYDEWLPMLERRLPELRDVDLAALSDRSLEDHLLALKGLFAECFEIHAILHGSQMIVIADLAFTCRDLLGWEDGKTLGLVSGLSYKSTEPSRRLSELARMARERPALGRLLEHVNETTIYLLVEADSEFAHAFAAYQREFGCRVLGGGEARTIAEVPSLTLGLVRDQMLRGYDPEEERADLERKRAALEAEARLALVDASAADRERFERVLAAAKRAYPVREDNEFYTIGVPSALLRYAFLEVGRRLAERGKLTLRDDVFFLEFDEALTALRDRDARQDMVRRRKGEHAWTLAHPGPASYGKDPGPPPSFKGLPREARFAHEALMWVIDRMGMKVPQETLEANARQRGSVVRGIPASGGRYTGPVRVIMDESEFHKLQAGDVLVCPVTSPVWSVLFPSIGAIVTNTGGILSHPAIIAREYRIPAVVATGNASSLFTDGQVVTVDGDAGVVEVHA